MERLTHNDKLFGCQLKGYIIVYGDIDKYNEAIHKLAAYEDAEEQGRLVTAKFPIDTMVYMESPSVENEIERGIVCAFSHGKTLLVMPDVSNDGGWTNETMWANNDDLYAAEAEAEAALSKKG